MAQDHEALLSSANHAGYFLQLRVADVVKSTFDEHQWEVLSAEHRWFDAALQGEQFIDLILRNYAHLIVIECKKVREGSWVFLEAQHGVRDREVANAYRIQSKSCDWEIFGLNPTSSEADFCIERKAGRKRGGPQLEQLAASLLRSVEGLAAQELAIMGESREQRFLFPVIVTNADLYLCSFRAGDIDLATGELSEAKFKAVPWIRFRKSLAAGSTPDRERCRDLGEANRNSERTVMIVGAEHLTAFLKEHRLIDMKLGRRPR